MARKILFFTGKGGTGKSMVAAGFAMAQASMGRRVLLVELGESSFYQGILTDKELKFEPLEVNPNLFLAHWEGYSSLKDYIHFLVKSEAITNLIYENPFMKTLIDVGPSLAELAIVGKITSGVRRVGPPLNYDLIVIDAFATGHMLAMLRAPLGIAEAVKFGPMATQCRDMVRVLRDTLTTGYYIVALPEDLPTTESLDLFHEIHLEIGVRAEFIVNKVSNLPASKENLLKIIADDQVQTEIKGFTGYILQKADSQQKQIDRIKADAPTVKIVNQVLSSDPAEILSEIKATFSGWEI